MEPSTPGDQLGVSISIPPPPEEVEAQPQQKQHSQSSRSSSSSEDSGSSHNNGGSASSNSASATACGMGNSSGSAAGNEEAGQRDQEVEIERQQQVSIKYFELLEELLITSSSQQCWLEVEPTLVQDERCQAVPEEYREKLYYDYVSMQGEVEMRLAEQEPLLWSKVQRQLRGSLDASQSLTTLKLQASSLKLLPACIGKLSSLHTVDLSNCIELWQLSASIGQLSNLETLNLAFCTFWQLPSSIGQLGKMRKLDLSMCIELRQLPDTISQLSSLEELNLSGCMELRELPQSIGQLSSLKCLWLMSCKRLRQLPNSITQLGSLVTLNLSYCEQLQDLPACTSQLSSLQTLDLSNCSELQSLTTWTSQLSMPSLRAFRLSGSEQLEELPTLMGDQLSGLLTLDLSVCEKLRELPASICQLRGLQKLNLSGCKLLRELPDAIGQLASLQELNLENCWSMRELPASIGQLSSLRQLNIVDCMELETLPDLSGCKHLVLLFANTFKFRYIRDRPLEVPLDYLPPKMQKEQPSFVLDQAEALLQQCSTAISWIAILLATACFVGFLTVPGGTNDAGLVKVADPECDDPEECPTAMNRVALRSYFVCNLLTFFLALATALFSVAENMPHSNPPTALRVISTITISTLLLFFTILSGSCTFLSGVYSVYPVELVNTDMVPPTVISGVILFSVFGWYFWRVGSLVMDWYKLNRDAITDMKVTAPDNPINPIKTAAKSIQFELLNIKQSLNGSTASSKTN